MAVNGNCRTTFPMNPNSVLAECLPSSERQICFFFFGFSLIFEVVSVVIDLFFVCSATVDYCLLTEKQPLYIQVNITQKNGKKCLCITYSIL